ncbi:MAG TPA: tRNA (adenosine(37)-N6)-dimethylallyltransferase MiaA [Stellaceae bacterium]|nr:tRNA (adenosine(37)-N6)-dimethylallyltransferase MiaA [Stellaceae bacterium]
MTHSDTPILLITGPTTSGKSRLAIAIAEEFRGTVINSDSMQIYRDLAVLTARPGPAELARVPHRLFGVLDASELCSAARWLDLAEAEIAAAARAARLPVLVGGTGLYLKALLRGLAPVPEIPAEVRRAARALHKEIGGERFHAALAARDPKGAARLNPGDTQRLVRAYEVMAATGRSLTDWQREQGRAMRPGVAAIVLLPPRDVLYAAIDARFASMAEAGALDEVRALMVRHLSPDLPAVKAMGVQELAAHLRGETTLEAAIAAAQQASRRYAKRQMTWLRTQLPPPADLPTHTLPAQFSESLLPEIFSFIRQFLLTTSPQAV